MLMVPMALKELIAAFVNLLDTVMLGEFGEEVIAAVGIANQWYFLFTVVVFGMCGGAGVFASQYWGAKDVSKVKKVLGLNIILVILSSMVFIVPALVIPEKIIRLFRQDPEVVAYGVEYIRIACFSYLFAALTSAYDMSLCCSENANISFVSRFVGLITNFVLNWALIYGKLGLPALGVKGAAIATIIARMTELAIIICTVYARKLVQAAGFRELFDIPRNMIGGYFRAALPVMFNEGAWALGTTVYSWVYAQISTEAVVITTIVQNIERLLLVFFHGGGNAAGIMIGKLVGGGEYEKAYNDSKRLFLMNALFSLCISLVFVIIRPLALMPYKITAEIRQETLNILVLTAVLMNIKALTFFLIVGVFRNGGATKSAAVIDIGSMWVFGVPVVVVCGIFLKIPLFYLYMLMMLEEVVKISISVPYFFSRRWIKNLVKNN